jgi:hypothetical protein
MALFTVIMLIMGFSLPHICMDDVPTIKAEQSLKSIKIALDDHQGGSQDGSKTKDACCTSHHCCFAKLLNTGPLLSQMAFYSNANLTVAPSVDFSSFNPKAFDRPPKFFA